MNSTVSKIIRMGCVMEKKLCGTKCRRIKRVAAIALVAALFIMHTNAAYVFAQSPQLEFRQMSDFEIMYEFGDAVFMIEVSEDGEQFFTIGTGFVVEPSGVAIMYLYSDFDYVRIRTKDDELHEIYEVLYFHQATGLHSVQLSGDEYTAVQIGTSAGIVEGQNVTVLGVPLKHNQILSFTAEVYGFHEEHEENAVVINGSIPTGTNGGPVFNRMGQVVGIYMASSDEVRNRHYAIVIDIVLENGETDSDLTELMRDTATIDFDEDNPHKEMVEELLVLPVFEALLGTWLWSGGRYDFFEDSFGWRNCQGEDYGDFIWAATEDFISLLTDDGSITTMALRFLNDYNVVMGGVRMVRYEAPVQYLVEVFMMGIWVPAGESDQATVLFYDNTGVSVTFHDDGTFTVDLEFNWRVWRDWLILEREYRGRIIRDTQRFLVLDENTLRFWMVVGRTTIVYETHRVVWD